MFDCQVCLVCVLMCCVVGVCVCAYREETEDKEWVPIAYLEPTKET